jgi:hypothetical protein
MISLKIFLILKILSHQFKVGYHLIFLSLSSSKTEFLIIGLPKQLAKRNRPTISLPKSVTLSPVDSARNPGVIFYSSLSFSEHISAISKSCLHHIRDFKRIRNSLDHTTVCIIATAQIVI